MASDKSTTSFTIYHDADSSTGSLGNSKQLQVDLDYLQRIYTDTTLNVHFQNITNFDLLKKDGSVAHRGSNMVVKCKVTELVVTRGAVCIEEQYKIATDDVDVVDDVKKKSVLRGAYVHMFVTISIEVLQNALMKHSPTSKEDTHVTSSDFSMERSQMERKSTIGMFTTFIRKPMRS
jgi:hypothetical protein